MANGFEKLAKLVKEGASKSSEGALAEVTGLKPLKLKIGGDVFSSESFIILTHHKDDPQVGDKYSCFLEERKIFLLSKIVSGRPLGICVGEVVSASPLSLRVESFTYSEPDFELLKPNGEVFKAGIRYTCYIDKKRVYVLTRIGG